jgi:L-threonylcarbamoyladenylate synthase
MPILDARDPRTAAPAIERAADLLRAGGLLGLPTETVYGLAADAENDAAVASIFAAKGRPADHPLIVHVAPAAAADDAGALPAAVAHFADAVPGFAAALARAFWPGPLTLILPRRAGVARACAGGQDSIGIRCPSHPVAQRLLAACAARGVRGLAAPSANPFGRISPTRAAHVADGLGADLPVLDGGDCAVGIESTIVDCSRGRPVLLRPGAITREQLADACGLPVEPSAELRARADAADGPSGRTAADGPDAGAGAALSPEPGADAAPRASGTLEAHYAPRAPLRLLDAGALRSALDALPAGAAGGLVVYARAALRLPAGALLRRAMPDDAAAAAHELFAALREFDDRGAARIWVEAPPAGAAWDGIRDRLQRAAAGGAASLD